MVCLFNLWNFYQNPDGTLEFEVTEANFPGIKDGTENWINTCLSVFGIDTEIERWEITPCRSFYYTDYPEVENWEDLWPTCWIVKVFPVDRQLTHTNLLFGLPNCTEAADITWSYEYDDPRHNQIALFISDFRTRKDDVEQILTEGLELAQITEARNVGIEPFIRAYPGGIYQLRLVIRGISFPGAVDSLAGILKYCKAHQGAINWRDRLTW